ncbi:hypothetical protein SH501x_000995 [Pirellulaceae bacterium SH501]
MQTMSSSLRFQTIAALAALLTVIAVPTRLEAQPKIAIPKFKIQYWDIPGRVGRAHIKPGGLNNYGQLIGNYYDANDESRPFLYEPQINPTSAMDLRSITEVPEGWEIEGVAGINDNGIIFGRMTSQDPETGLVEKWPFLLDTLADELVAVPIPDLPSQLLSSLPNDLQSLSTSSPIAISNHGDLLFRFSVAPGEGYALVFNPWEQTVNYFDQLVFSVFLGNSLTGPAIVGGRYADGSVFRWTPETGTIENFNLTMAVFAMNDRGVIAGQFNSRAARLITAPPRMFSNSVVAWDVNNSNDLALSGGILFRDDVGSVTITNYLSGTKADRNRWYSATSNLTLALNDRQPASGFSQMAGYLTFQDGTQQPYLVTPIAK